MLRVLAKPELDNAIILNEFIMIMENFGVVDNFEDDDDDDDYIKTDDETLTEASKSQLIKDSDKDTEHHIKDGNVDNKISANNEEAKDDGDKSPSKAIGNNNNNDKPKKKKKIQINFDLLEEKGLKILRKLARFLLERYLHPREFFGPAIYK